MVDFKPALRGTLENTVDGEEIIATTQEAIEGIRNDVIATPASISAYVATQDFAGDMTKAVYDPQGINADAFDRQNQTGTQDISTVDGLQAALDGRLESVVAGTNVTIDDTDPQNPVINANASGGMVDTVIPGAGINVDATDPVNPIVSVESNLESWNGVSRASGFDTFASSPTSANLASLVTGETGTGALVFANSPTLVTPNLGTPSAINLANATNFPTFVASVVAGTNIAVNNADPANPVVSVSGISPPGLVLLAEYIVPAGGVAALDITTGIDSTYDEYEFRLVNVRGETDSDTLSMRFSTNGGSTFLSTSGDYVLSLLLHSSSATASSSATYSNSPTDQIMFAYEVSNLAAKSGVSGTISLVRPAQTQRLQGSLAVNFSASASSVIRRYIGVFGLTASAAVNAVRFQMGSGDMAEGSIVRHYGIRKAP